MTWICNYINTKQWYVITNASTWNSGIKLHKFVSRIGHQGSGHKNSELNTKVSDVNS